MFVATDPEAGELTVRLAHGDEQARGRAPMERGILGAVEATVYAVRTFVDDLPFLPGWARVIETTADRRFLVAASVTDPQTRQNLRGIAEGDNPIDGAARATLAALNRVIGPGLGRRRRFRQVHVSCPGSPASHGWSARDD